MELELKHLKLNPVTVTVTPVFPASVREHETFLGHEMKGPAGTRRGGVSMAGGR